MTYRERAILTRRLILEREGQRADELDDDEVWRLVRWDLRLANRWWTGFESDSPLQHPLGSSARCRLLPCHECAEDSLDETDCSVLLVNSQSIQTAPLLVHYGYPDPRNFLQKDAVRRYRAWLWHWGHCGRRGHYFNGIWPDL